MKLKKKYLFLIFMAIVAVLATSLVAGCGEEEEFVCRRDTKLVPDPEGKPQLIYLYRDT